MSAAHRPGPKGSAIAGCPSAGLSHQQQSYIVKQRQESPSQCQSDAAGLLLLQMTNHISEDSQGLHVDVRVFILQSLHDFWQQNLHVRHLYRKTPYVFSQEVDSHPGQDALVPEHQPPAHFLAAAMGISPATFHQAMAMNVVIK